MDIETFPMEGLSFITIFNGQISKTKFDTHLLVDISLKKIYNIDFSTLFKRKSSHDILS